MGCTREQWSMSGVCVSGRDKSIRALTWERSLPIKQLVTPSTMMGRVAGFGLTTGLSLSMMFAGGRITIDPRWIWFDHSAGL